MYSTFKYLAIQLCKVLPLAVFLSACGGGGGGQNAAPVINTPVTVAPVTDTPAATSPANSEPSPVCMATLPDSSKLVINNEAANRDSNIALETKLSVHALQSNAKHHPTRVLARLLDGDNTVNGLQKQSNQFASLGLRQIAGFASAKVSSAIKLNGNSLPAANNLAVFEITQPGLAVADAVVQLQKSGLVAFAEPDWYVSKSLAPDDSRYNLFWHLKNTGQSGGIVDNDIGAETAWNTATGNGEVVVAVIDDGVDYRHPDLAPNMWTSVGTPCVVVPSDILGNSCVTDDANGVNLAPSRGSDTSILPYNVQDSDHGTMVAGFIGAKGNNSIGGSGVAWNVKVMGIKVENPDFSLPVSGLTNGIRYVIAKKAAGVNVKVINISLGSPTPSQALREALEEANAQGILVVVAAGNNGSNNSIDVGYPSRYQTPNLISVGALNRFNLRSSFSNYGSLVHLFAPGEQLPTTSSRMSLNPSNGFIAPNYRFTSGTSFASPIVAGAAALLMMQYPNESIVQIKTRLLHGVTPFLTATDSLSQGKLNLGNSISPIVTCLAASPV
jgi:subtilisin family serine protease